MDFTVPPQASGQRLDVFLKTVLEEDFSREALKQAIRDGRCTIHGKEERSPSAKVRAGTVITFLLPSLCSGIVPEEGPIDIIYADEDLVVCNKPANLTVHPCPSCPENTLIQRLASRFPSLREMEGERPGVVHRIDKDTSGLLLVALNERARLRLAEDFAQRKIHKEYLAIATGKVPESVRVDEAIGRDPEKRIRMAILPEDRGGKEAHTLFERLWLAPDQTSSLVKVQILTGRTHQIRVHMHFLGHPLLGDALYAPEPIRSQATRQMLHAWRLHFTHPISGKTLSFSCPPPKDFQDCLRQCQKQTQCIVITGNPGSGKSQVLKAFEEQGAACISADELVRSYYASKGEIACYLASHYGEELLEPSGAVDRERLLALFEERPDIRREIERLAHSLVLGEIKEFFQNSRAKKIPRCCAEIPLYFECGWHKGKILGDNILCVGVAAGQSIRAQRLAENRQWSEQKIATIEGWQWPEEKKLAACDFIVQNSASLESLAQELAYHLLPQLNALQTTEDMESLWEKQTPHES